MALKTLAHAWPIILIGYPGHVTPYRINSFICVRHTSGWPWHKTLFRRFW